MFMKEVGFYNDFNFVDKSFSGVISTASFYLYAVGLVKDKLGAKKLLELLEFPYGVSTCEYKEKESYLQWDYPLMWAPQMYFVYEALKASELYEEAERIATKYMQTVERNFDKTGILWENIMR